VNAVTNAAFASWTLSPPAIAVLLLAAFFYLRGWLRIRRLVHDERDAAHLASYLSGLGILFLATGSPLDSFDNLFLSAHMSQHLLLMMLAPPLILLGHPVVPLLRGLPKQFVKEGLGPFLTWPPLRSVLRRLTSPPLAFGLFAVSTIFWHLPRFYELALRSPAWHGIQHACFFWTGILFWWPIIQPGPQPIHAKPHYPRWTAIPLLLAGDIVNTVLSAFFVFSGRVLYPAYESVRASRMSALDDQILAGLIMWVPGSVIYLVPALVIAVRLFSSDRFRRRPVITRVKPSPPRAPFPIAKFRRPAQAVLLVAAIAIMAEGFFGTQIAPLNLAGVLPWIHWRTLSLCALLLVGNLFCMACPFTLVRDLGRKFLPARLRWPRALRTKWLSIALLLLYLWAYEAFSLWDSPALTAFLIAGYFLAALAIDGVFRGASFCKYVCPIGQFHFITSLVSPREVRVRSTAVCQTCSTYDCIRGNQHARGCELYLFQPKKSSNLDCTFCLDCVKACPHSNVALLPVAPAKTLIADPYRSSIGRLSKRTDLAALALVIVFGAFLNAVQMTSPVPSWKFQLWILIPLALLLLPRTPRSLSFALVPLGVSMWTAHLLFHFLNAVSPALTAALLHPTQLLLLDAGLLLSLYIGWRLAKLYVARKLFLPWAALAAALYTWGIWILFEPMQMRGMLH
jgi:cytochrome c oxidase assembly factor CtaG/ferredoxin